MADNDIEIARLLALRGALKLEVRGMKRHGRSARVIANEAMGTSHRTCRAAYAALNKYIVDRLGPEFDKPLNF